MKTALLQLGVMILMVALIVGVSVGPQPTVTLDTLYVDTTRVDTLWRETTDTVVVTRSRLDTTPTDPPGNVDHQDSIPDGTLMAQMDTTLAGLWLRTTYFFPPVNAWQVEYRQRTPDITYELTRTVERSLSYEPTWAERNDLLIGVGIGAAVTATLVFLVK